MSLTSCSAASSKYLTSVFTLRGRSAIITGGGTGIGAALAMGLARAGAAVVLTGRRPQPLEDTCGMIQEQLRKDATAAGHADAAASSESSTRQAPPAPPPARAFYYSADVTDEEQLTELVRQAESLTGIPPTILINNAGVNVRQKAEDLTGDHWRASLDLMLTAPFLLTRAMSSNMQREHYGRIINVASLQSFVAFPASIPYAAAKSGVGGLTRAISEAYSSPRGYPNVTCNAIAPGYVRTELTASVFADAERSQRLADATLLGRNSVPEDLVGPVLFLASPAASYVTGQILPVDGGFTALGMR